MRATATDTARMAGCVISVEPQPFFRSFKADFGKTIAQGLVRFCESVTGEGIFFGQFLAHADRLRPLAGKQKSDRVCACGWGGHENRSARFGHPRNDNLTESGGSPRAEGTR